MTKKLSRIVYLLFVCVILTTSIISNTFAKYATSETTVDSARVSKWGVNIELSGSLFGNKYYGKDGDNGIYVNDNGKSVTIISNNQQAIDGIDNIVAPGAQNSDGLSISITGSPETAVQLSGKIVSQNVALKTNIYALMTKVGTNITESEYRKLVGDYGTLYHRVENSISTISSLDEITHQQVTSIVDGYKLVENYSDIENNDPSKKVAVYAKSDVIEISNKQNESLRREFHWPYCPIIFEYKPIDNTIANPLRQEKLKNTSITSNYWISRNDKSIDILSALLEYSTNGTASWPEPTPANSNKVERILSKELAPNTDLKNTLKFHNKLTWVWDYEQYPGDNPHYYVYPFDNSISKGSTDAFSLADTYLGHLAAEKQNLNKDSNDSNNPLWEVVIHNRSLIKHSSNTTVFGKYKDINDTYEIRYVGNSGTSATNLLQSNVNQLKDEWIIPTEYGDYCLESCFNIELTISQID